MHPDDLRLVDDFESGALVSFPHHDHLRVAWILLERDGYTGAAAAITRGIRAMAIAIGDVTKYHETRTIAWLRLIDAARTAVSSPTSQAFVDDHAELLERHALSEYYSDDLLRSPDARTAFQEPDLRDLPSR